MDRITGKNVKAWWYAPRDGSRLEIGVYPSTGTREFAPPSRAAQNDWVLILDDAERAEPAERAK